MYFYKLSWLGSLSVYMSVRIFSTKYIIFDTDPYIYSNVLLFWPLMISKLCSTGSIMKFSCQRMIDGKYASCLSFGNILNKQKLPYCSNDGSFECLHFLSQIHTYKIQQTNFLYTLTLFEFCAPVSTDGNT